MIYILLGSPRSNLQLLGAVWSVAGVQNPYSVKLNHCLEITAFINLSLRPFRWISLSLFTYFYKQ